MNRTRMPGPLAALLGVVFHVSLSSALAACGSPQENIVWLNLGGDTKKTAVFIPEKLLQETDWPKLPLTQRDISGLEARVRLPETLEERRRTLGREEDLCWNQSAPSGEGGSYRDAKDLRDWLKDFELSVVAQVEAVVPGWDSWQGEVAQMVYVRVLDVLRDQKGKANKGSLLLYKLHYGSIFLKGTQICRDPWKGFKIPVPGNEILLLGRPFWSDASYMGFTFVFPIEEGKVQYQPYSAVEPFISIELKNLS